MSSSVPRLPVQHRTKPYCESCYAELPNFSGFTLDASELGAVTILAVIFVVKCACGAEWHLRKNR